MYEKIGVWCAHAFGVCNLNTFPFSTELASPITLWLKIPFLNISITLSLKIAFLNISITPSLKIAFLNNSITPSLKMAFLNISITPSSLNISIALSLKMAHHITQVPRSAVCNVSGNRCESDCRSRCREFAPGPVPYFRGDWSWNDFYGHSPPFHWIIQEGLLSVTSESMCTKYWLTACSSLPRKKCG